MKQKLTLFALLTMALAIPQSVFAYNYSAVTPSGQRLYYTLSGTSAIVVAPYNGYSWNGFTKPTGDLVIPNTVTNSFGNSYSVISIEPNAFNGCTGLTSVIIGDSISSIGGNAFNGCTGLTSVTVGESISSIGNNAFGGCSGLTSVIFNADSCTSAGSYNNRAFYSGPNISSIIFGNNVKVIPDYLCYDQDSLISVTIPNSVILIGNQSFSGCDNLTSVTIGNSVVSIGNYAFTGCVGLTGTLTLPNSVITIGNYAFNGCAELTGTLTIPTSVASIGDNAFGGCTGITYVVFNAENCTGGGRMGSDNSTIYAPFINLNSIVSFTFGNNVKRIPAYLCYGLSGLTTLTIPDSISYIGNAAFRGCTGLTTVIFNADSCTYGKTNDRWWYEYPAFDYLHNITSLTFGENVKTIPDFLCRGLIGLTSITIPHSVKYIGNSAFKQCDNITSVIFNADSCTYAGHYESHSLGYGVYYYDYPAFFGNNYTSITFDNNVKLIPPYLCYRWRYLDSVAIPNTVTSIGNNSFFGCGLTTVTIPDAVTSIAVYSFANCSYLSSVTSLAINPPELGNWCFDSVNMQIPVYVPCESLSAYQSAYGWSLFSNIQCNHQQTYIITATSANPTMGNVTGGGTYNEGATATLTATANSGYHFTQWQDGNTQNPRTITVTGDATYTAYFEADGEDDDCLTITSFPWNATFDEDLTCWKTVDADGDGYNWMNYQYFVVSESYSYFDGTNQGLTPDNWLISQRMQIPSNGTYTLSWTAAGLSDDYYNEHYSVYVSTTGDSPSDFTTPLFSETLNTPNAVNRSKSLENYRGQTVRIAFRHHNTNDVFVLGVGNVTISQNTQGIDDIDENGLLVYVEGDNIHIDDVAGQSVTVYAIDGRIISAVTNATGCLSIPVAAAGVYIVKVGNHPARKVVVIR